MGEKWANNPHLCRIYVRVDETPAAESHKLSSGQDLYIQDHHFTGSKVSDDQCAGKNWFQYDNDLLTEFVEAPEARPPSPDPAQISLRALARAQKDAAREIMQSARDGDLQRCSSVATSHYKTTSQALRQRLSMPAMRSSKRSAPQHQTSAPPVPIIPFKTAANGSASEYYESQHMPPSHNPVYLSETVASPDQDLGTHAYFPQQHLGSFLQMPEPELDMVPTPTQASVSPGQGIDHNATGDATSNSSHRHFSIHALVGDQDQSLPESVDKNEVLRKHSQTLSLSSMAKETMRLGLDALPDSFKQIDLGGSSGGKSSSNGGSKSHRLAGLATALSSIKTSSSAGSETSSLSSASIFSSSPASSLTCPSTAQTSPVDWRFRAQAQ
jgi:hypothetical protein